MNHGLLGDFGEMQKNQGKRYSAPDCIAKASESPRFPTIEADSLAGDRVSAPEVWHGKVTFVTVGFRAFSKPMLDGYRSAFAARFGSTAGCQLVEISVVDSFVLRTLLSSSIMTALRKEADGDEARLRTTLCYTGPDAQSIKEQLGVRAIPSVTAPASAVQVQCGCCPCPRTRRRLHHHRRQHHYLLTCPPPLLLHATTTTAAHLHRTPWPETEVHVHARSLAPLEAQVFNAATGYGFLLDKNGRIRWRVHGHIDDAEVKTLERCVSELLCSSR